MHQDVLVNLSGTIPSFFSRFDRVAEIVPEAESTRESARENYRQYKPRATPPLSQTLIVAMTKQTEDEGLIEVMNRKPAFGEATESPQLSLIEELAATLERERGPHQNGQIHPVHSRIF